MFLQIIILIFEAIHIVLGVFAIPIYRMYKGGSLLINTLLCWGLWIIWAFTWCVILLGIVYPYSRETLKFFPEAIGVPAIIVMGWVPSLLVCLLACGIISVIKRESRSGAADRAPGQTP